MTGQMQLSRTVKVARISQSEIWSTLSQTVFSNYWFCWEAQDDGTQSSQKSAKTCLEFIDFSPDLYGISDYGQNPYERPFLNFYVIEVRAGKDLAESQKNDVIKWSANALMTQTTHLVLILQEQQMFKNKAIDPEAVFRQEVPDTSTILVVPFKNKPSPKLTDEAIAQIQEATRARIIADFESYLAGAEQRIDQLTGAAKFWERWRLKVWRSLLLYSFGFTRPAQDGFQECYDGLIQEWKEPLKPLLQRQLDARNITDHPFTLSEDPADVMSFALQGLMAVLYSNQDMDGVVDLFFQYFAFLRKMCRTPEEYAEVDRWGENGITVLLPLTKNNPLTRDTTRLHMRLFSLIYERDGDLEQVYRNLMANLQSDRVKEAVQAQYMRWARRHGKPYDNAKLTSVFGWCFGAEAAAVMFKKALEQDPVDQATAQMYGKFLLADSTPYNEKRFVLEMLGKLDAKTRFKEPFRVSVSRLESPAFSATIPAGSPFDISVKLKGPNWLPDTFDEIVLVADLMGQRRDEKGQKRRSTRRLSTSGSISDVLVFHVDLDKPGKWKILGFELRSANVRMGWEISKPHTISISAHREIPTQVTFPRLITPLKPIPADITFNMTDVSSQSLELSVSFVSEAVELLPQEGTAKFTTDDSSEDVAFTLGENGKLTFAQDPCRHLVAFPLMFTLKDPSVETAKLVISSRIDGQEFENVSVLQNIFPLTCEGRLMSDEVMHLCLCNACDVPLYISNDTISEMAILPNQKTYLLQKRTDETFTLNVREKDSETMTKSWPLDESLMMKRVRAELDKKMPIPVGSIVGVKVSIPQCSSYRIEGGPDIVVVGQTCVSNFKGGEVSFQVIPLTGGTVGMPNIIVDGKSQTVHPQFMDVVCSSLLSYGPFLTSSSC